MTADPHLLFEDWFAEARASEPNDPEAMALATADASGRPSARMVLLKRHDERGFAFYTNADSRKGAELAANPRAALLFHWKSLRRQVRVEGAIEPVSRTNPTPISHPFRATPGSGPGRPTNRARWTAGPPSRHATRASSPNSKARMSAVLLIGAAIESSPTGSNSGATGRTGCTNGGCSPSARTGAGPRACSTHERARLADHARRYRQRRRRLVPARPQELRRLGPRSCGDAGLAADTALDLVASLVTLFGSVRRRPRRPRSPLGTACPLGARRFGPVRPDPISAIA